MKRTLILFLLTALPIWAMADYQEEYAKGQAAYKRGKYVSAREHFMNVLQEKVYANVVEYIHMCNEKIDEQHGAEITKLREDNRNTTIERVKEIRDANNEKAQRLKAQYDKSEKAKRDCEAEHERLTDQLKDSSLLLGQMRHRIDSLQTITDNLSEKELKKIYEKIEKEKSKQKDKKDNKDKK